MKQIKTKKGVLKYRMPGILESYDLIIKSGVIDGDKSVYQVKRKIIEEMEFLVDTSLLDGGLEYKDILGDVKMFNDAIEQIVGDITQEAFIVLGKKH